MQVDHWRTRSAQNRVVVVPSQKPFLGILRRPVSDRCKRVSCSVQVSPCHQHIQIRRWSGARVRVKPFTEYGTLETNCLDPSRLKNAKHVMQRRLNMGLPDVPNDQPPLGPLSQPNRKLDSGICQTTIEVTLHAVKKSRMENCIPGFHRGAELTQAGWTIGRGRKQQLQRAFGRERALWGSRPLHYCTR